MNATYVKVELLNIDGSVLGFARIKLAPALIREAIGKTIGIGYSERVDLPVPEIGDPRCPYGIQVTVE